MCRRIKEEVDPTVGSQRRTFQGSRARQGADTGLTILRIFQETKSDTRFNNQIEFTYYKMSVICMEPSSVFIRQITFCRTFTLEAKIMPNPYIKPKLDSINNLGNNDLNRSSLAKSDTLHDTDTEMGQFLGTTVKRLIGPVSVLRRVR